MRSGIIAATVPRVQIICRCNSLAVPARGGQSHARGRLDEEEDPRDVAPVIGCIFHDILGSFGYLIVASGAFAAYIAQPFRKRS
jgi:hypothetical protein